MCDYSGVLADEPTGNLDSRSGDEAFKIMREMNRENEVALIMVTHDDRLAEEADRILMIEDGCVHVVDKRKHRMKLLNSLSQFARPNDARRLKSIGGSR